MKTIRVLVADGQPLFSEALAAALEHFPGLVSLEGQPSSSDGTLEMIQALEPDVAVIDYWIPGSWPPADLLIQLRRMVTTTKTILLSWLYSERDIESVLGAGAAGFLPKSVGLADLVEAIHRAHAGQLPVLQDRLEQLTGRIHTRDEQAGRAWDRLKDLTPRERTILVLLASGLSVKQMAERLSLSPATTRTHVGNVLKKTGSASRVELVALARSHGLVQL